MAEKANRDLESYQFPWKQLGGERVVYLMKRTSERIHVYVWALPNKEIIILQVLHADGDRDDDDDD